MRGGLNFVWGGCVLKVHSKITFSIARNVIMIGLLSKRGALRQRPSFLFLSARPIQIYNGSLKSWIRAASPMLLWRRGICPHHGREAGLPPLWWGLRMWCRLRRLCCGLGVDRQNYWLARF